MAGLVFTEICSHLSKGRTRSHLIIERTSLYVQTVQELVCIDFGTEIVCTDAWGAAIRKSSEEKP